METFAEAAKRLLAGMDAGPRGIGKVTEQPQWLREFRLKRLTNAHRRAHGEAGSVLGKSSFPLRSPLVLKADNDNGNVVHFTTPDEMTAAKRNQPHEGLPFIAR